jgi:translation initiation factor 2 (IF-2; GTPase)
MLNKRVVVAIAVMGTLAVPAVSVITPVAQAQVVPAAADVNDASKQIVVDQPRVGDAKITGKVLIADGENSQKVAVLFVSNVHRDEIQVTRDTTMGADLVSFEYTVPTSRPLQEGEAITVGIPGNQNTFQTVTVQKALTPETSPAPVPDPGNEHKPEVEQPTPQPQDKEQQPEGGNKQGENQQSPMPEAEKKPEGEAKPEREQQAPSPEAQKKPEADEQKPTEPKTPENEGMKPGDKKPEGPKPSEEKKPEAPKAPEKEPEVPKAPEKKPEGPKRPGEDSKKPEIDKGALQGSSNIGDFFKTLTAIGGVVGVVSGVVKLFTQGFSGPHFLQPLRGFLAQFNIKF